jgi:hypothetical protein
VLHCFPEQRLIHFSREQGVELKVADLLSREAYYVDACHLKLLSVPANDATGPAVVRLRYSVRSPRSVFLMLCRDGEL